LGSGILNASRFPFADWPLLNDNVQVEQQRPMTRLHVISDILCGNTFDLSADYITIGRAADNTICLDHASVSKHHATLTVDGNDFKLCDLHSTNGTIVNGDSIVCTHLKDGDRITLGDIELRFALAEKSRALSPSPSAPPLSPPRLVQKEAPVVPTAASVPSKPKPDLECRVPAFPSTVPVLIAAHGPLAADGKKEPALVIKPPIPAGPIQIKKPLPSPQKEPPSVVSQLAAPLEPVLPMDHPRVPVPRKGMGALLHVGITSVGLLLLIIGYAGESNALKSLGLIALTTGFLCLLVVLRSGSIIAPPKRRL
jgi:predicted component of type VI protein secretion system